MSSLMDNLALTKAILSNPEMIRVKPAVSLFMLQYLRKFSVRNVGGNLVIHSNTNYALMRKYYRGNSPIPVEDTRELMQEVRFGAPARFNQLRSS